MKYGESFTMRGSMELPTTGTFDLQLIADDGIPTFGYRIKEFKLVPQTYEGQAVMYPDCIGLLSTNPPTQTSSRFLFSEPNQMAWAMFDTTSGAGLLAEIPFLLIDDAVFVRELWLKAWVMPNTANSGQFNYFIEIERVRLSDIEALVHLATEVNA